MNPSRDVTFAVESVRTNNNQQAILAQRAKVTALRQSDS